MRWRNDERGYGLVAALLHWLGAAGVAALFALGLWMVRLDYYDPWYHEAPALHKALGLSLFVLTVVRLGWRLFTVRPSPLPGHTYLERLTAGAVHAMLYLLLFAVPASGYLLSTADGRPIDLFGWFAIPATITGIERQEDVAGEVHLALAVALIALVALHALAAIKHHFFNKDRTLLRMLGR